VGGLGLAPGANLGERWAVFEATHGSAPRYRGTHRANPMGLMLSGAMLLRHLGEVDAADRLEAAVADVIAQGRTVTYDLRPSRDDAAATTEEVVDAVVERLTGSRSG
jgi:isocitrate dehydrogenase (NAD+)